MSEHETTPDARSGGETKEPQPAKLGEGVEVPAPARTLVKLDVACGASKPAGWVGIDVARVPGVDHVHDLFHFPWPVAADSVGEVRCVHFVEHIPHRECAYVHVDESGNVEHLAQDRWARSVRRWGHVRDLWWDFWAEVYRVCADGAEVECITPYYSSRRADQDPTHERRICEESYLYLDQEWLERNRCAYPFAGDFQIVACTMLSPAGHVPQERLEHDLNVVTDMVIRLKVRKPAGRPARAWWEKSNG